MNSKIKAVYRNACLLFGLLLVSILLLSACRPVPPRVSNPGAVKSTQAIPGTGLTDAGPVIVKDQPLTGNTVIVLKVVSQGPGWMAIHAQLDGHIGPAIGEQHVENGVNNNVTVTIDPLKATPVLYAMLHVDAGQVGVYEFPGPDVPAMIGGVMVSPPFHVTLGQPSATPLSSGGLNGAPGAAASSAAASDAASSGAAAQNTPTAVAATTTTGAAGTSGAGFSGAAPAAATLEDAQKAVIRIVAEGTYEYPDFTTAQQLGSGSGFLISPDGLAMTNNHVVTGAGTIKVYFSDNQKAYNARVLGVSECSDLAVIQVEGQNFPYLSWYTAQPRLGLKVYSLGYPFGDPNLTQHAGAIAREQSGGDTSWTAVDSVIEHDAVIAPGNSGGPLVTQDGQVVGINYATNDRFNQYFAIPASAAVGVVKDLRNGENVTSLGINGEAMQSKDKSLSGVWVYSVASGSPADKSGIRAGDFLLEMEGIALGQDGTMTGYCDVLRSHTPTDTLSIKLARVKSGQMLEGQINGRPLAVTQAIPLTGDQANQGTPAADASANAAATASANAAATAAGTDAAAATAADVNNGKPAYFTEEFDGGLGGWTYFFFGKNNARFNLNIQDSRLVFDIQDPNVYVYLTYSPHTYTGVRLDAAVINQANSNNNNFSLLCRYDANKGWYEFNVTSGGLWDIMRYDAPTGQYVQLYNGGSTNIRLGQDRNIFGLACSGGDISAYINNRLVKTVTDQHFQEGQVGISVSSFDDVPVTMSFDTLTVSKP